MLDVIVYDSASKKELLDAQYASVSSPIERLNLYLDLIDFYRHFKSRDLHDEPTDSHEPDWIILDITKK